MHTLLVSAYGCEPNRGSEPGVGWNWVIEMAKRNKLHVITRANNKSVIETNIPDELRDNLHFYYYDPPRWIINMKRGDKGLYLFYFCWQVGILSTVKRILKNEKIDYTMHLSFGSLWMPTFLYLFKIPFIWGTLGGADGVPKSFIKIFTIRQRIIQSLRYALIKTTWLNPIVFLPARKADRILCRTENNAMAIPSRYRSKTRIMLETSIEDDVFLFHRKKRTDNVLNLIYTGRLVEFKNLRLALYALSRVRKEIDWNFTIVGDGPERKNLESEVKRLDIEQSVIFVGKKLRQETFELLEESDVFLFPSLREGGSWSLMEAMAIGVPPICLDWTGMHVIADKQSAWLLNVKTPSEMERDITHAIEYLAKDPLLREKLGDAARNRIKKLFNNASKGIFMETVFEKLDK